MWVYRTAKEAEEKKDTSTKILYKKGRVYKFKTYGNCTNISKKPDVAGGWISNFDLHSAEEGKVRYTKKRSDNIMAIKTLEELTNVIKSRFSENPTDDDISLLEDLTDTYKFFFGNKQRDLSAKLKEAESKKR